MIENESWRHGVRSATTRLVRFDEWLDWLLDHRVTVHDGTFTRFDLTRAVASALPTSTSAEVVEATVQRALGSPAVGPICDHSSQLVLAGLDCRVITDDRRRIYTSRSLLALEKRLVDQLVRGVATNVGVLEHGRVEAAVAASTLGDDQAAAVKSLASSARCAVFMMGDRTDTASRQVLGLSPRSTSEATNTTPRRSANAWATARSASP